MRRIALGFFVLSALAACGRALGFDDIVPPPASGGTCDLRAPFTTVKQLTTLHDVGEGRPTLTADERTIFFHRTTPSGVRLFSSQRATRNDPFPATSTPIASVAAFAADAGFDALDPSMSSDGTRLYFAESAAQQNGLVVAYRADAAAPDFSSFFLLGLHAGGKPVLPYVTTDDELWFTRVDPVDAGNFGEVFHAHLYEHLDLVDEFPLGQGYAYVVSADGSFVYFNSARGGAMYMSPLRPDGGGITRLDLVNTVSPALNGPQGGCEPGWISTDNCRLYFVYDLDDAIYVAEREPGAGDPDATAR